MSNFNSAEEEIVFICDENQFRIATLLFATKQGVVKKVSGEDTDYGPKTRRIR